MKKRGIVFKDVSDHFCISVMFPLAVYKEIKISLLSLIEISMQEINPVKFSLEKFYSESTADSAHCTPILCLGITGFY